MKIAVIDNYDSFTYNLVHMLRVAIGHNNVMVFRNDTFAPQQLEPFDKILLSPGPGIPSEAGLMPQVIKTYATQKPILGVCLGHQALAEAFGAKLINLPQVYHGVELPVMLSPNAGPLFKNVTPTFGACRYHSWAVDAGTIAPPLEITATDTNGIVMALQHKTLPLFGVQFHPESILTPEGKTLITNWLSL